MTVKTAYQYDPSATKPVYIFDPDTGEYLGEGITGLDPLETETQGKDIYLLPANASFEAPPKAGPKQVAVMTDNGWTVKSDLRGAQYWLNDGSHHTIGKIGEDKPTGALDAAPTLPPTDTEIDAETVRRIADAWGADGQVDALAKQANAQSRMDTFLEILIGGKSLTPAQKTEKTAIEDKRKETTRLRAKGAALKALSTARRKGLDITDNQHWTGA